MNSFTPYSVAEVSVTHVVSRATSSLNRAKVWYQTPSEYHFFWDAPPQLPEPGQSHRVFQLHLSKVFFGSAEPQVSDEKLRL
jgi:hypothetical protein